MRRLLRAGQWTTVIVFLAICWLSVMPSQIVEVDNFNDKAKHIFAFFVLSSGMLYYWRVSWSLVVVALLGFGIAIEILQAYVPGRSASAADVLADLLGVALTLLMSWKLRLKPIA